MIDLEAIRANVTAVRHELEQQPYYFSDRGNAPPKTPVEQLVYDAMALLAEVERLQEYAIENIDARHDAEREVERNRCAECGCALADHDLTTGAITQCNVCPRQGSEDGTRDCFEPLRAEVERLRKLE